MPLPPQIVDVVHVPNEVGLLEPHPVPDLVIPTHIPQPLLVGQFPHFRKINHELRPVPLPTPTVRWRAGRKQPHRKRKGPLSGSERTTAQLAIAAGSGGAVDGHGDSAQAAGRSREPGLVAAATSRAARTTSSRSVNRPTLNRMLLLI